MKNRFQALKNKVLDQSTSDYDKFVQSSAEAAEQCLRKVPRQKKKVMYLNQREEKVIEEVEEAYCTYLAYNKNKQLREKCKGKKQSLYDVYAIIDQEELIGKVERVENAHRSSQHGAAWKLINGTSGRSSSQSSKLKASSPEERVQLWHCHFSNLLTSPPVKGEGDSPINQVFDTLNIVDGPFTEAQYAKAKKVVKCGKPCGDDGITLEFLKYAGLDDIVLGFINKAYSSGDLPERWKTLIIVPVPKTGDLTKPDKYRGISLISLVMKLFNTMLLNRIRPVFDPLLRTPQNGFRQKRTTVGQIMALRRLLEGVTADNLSCVLTFIVFMKAFKTIHRGRLLEILREYGVPQKLVTAIAAT